MNRMNRVGQFSLAKNLITALAVPSALCVAGIWAPVVVAQTSAPPATTSANQREVPSKLDYVVLASLADASSLLSMTAYRAPTDATLEDWKRAPGATAPQDGE